MYEMYNTIDDDNNNYYQLSKNNSQENCLKINLIYDNLRWIYVLKIDF